MAFGILTQAGSHFTASRTALRLCQA